MSCVLRASGEDFEVDDFLKGSPLKALVVVHRGDARVPGSTSTDSSHERSGMNISVSTREFSDLSGQIEDAIQFLSENSPELRRLRDFSSVEEIQLDFPIEDRDVVFQRDTFPNKLLVLMGELGVGLTVSRYPTSESSPDSR